MDEPDRLDKEADLSTKAQSGSFFWSRTLAGIFIAGGAYILSAIGLATAGYRYDSLPKPIIGNPEALLLFKVILFTIPFFLSALYFRFKFKYVKHRTILTVVALLLAWAAEKLAILGISSMIYSIPIWDLPQLMFRISEGGDQSAPWFTPDYVLFTFVGCIVLGLLASIRKRTGTKSRYSSVSE